MDHLFKAERIYDRLCDALPWLKKEMVLDDRYVYVPILRVEPVNIYLLLLSRTLMQVPHRVVQLEFR